MATTSAPHESFQPDGRPGNGAAAARTTELFRDYGRTVSGLCRALLRDRTEAEDAAQQTFLSAHRAILNGSAPREPAAWLATIARNECWGRIRTRMREPLPTDAVDSVSTENDPLAEAIRRADLAALWSAIEALPRQQREALLLREFGGLSYDELAAALAVSAPAVESLLFRARQRLRTQLRAAYASVSGASWLEWMARIVSGGGAPVAAKVAALGVGAAAVTGGAVVGPQVLERHHRQAPVPAPARAAPDWQRSALMVPAVLATPAPAHAETPAASGQDRNDAEHQAGAGAGSADEQQHEQQTGGRETTSDGSQEHSTHSTGGDGESHSGSDVSVPAGGDGSGDAPHGDGGDSSAPSAPDVLPELTVTVPPVEGDGG